MARAGYNPKEMITIFKYFKQVTPDEKTKSIFSTHPPMDFRIQQCEKFLQEDLPGLMQNSAKKGYIGTSVIYDKETKKPRIVWIIENSPAEKAGLKLRDLIISINGKELSYRSQAYFNKEWNTFSEQQIKAGNIELMIDRDGEKMPFAIEPATYYLDPDIKISVEGSK